MPLSPLSHPEAREEVFDVLRETSQAGYRITLEQAFELRELKYHYRQAKELCDYLIDQAAIIFDRGKEEYLLEQAEERRTANALHG